MPTVLPVVCPLPYVVWLNGANRKEILGKMSMVDSLSLQSDKRRNVSPSGGAH